MYQVTQNRKALQQLSAEVVRALLDLGKFYNECAHLLDDATELWDALDKLCTLVSKSAVCIDSYDETWYRQMRAVYKHCHELFPRKATGRINKALCGFRSLTKSKDIEAEILDLKNKVQACYIQFMVCIDP